MESTYFVYMLHCADGSYYVGVTNDVDRRLWEHQHGIDERSYTHERRPVSLVYSADFRDVNEAIAWEKHMKAWSRAKKRALADNDWKSIHEIVKAERRSKAKRPSTSAPRKARHAPLRMTKGETRAASFDFGAAHSAGAEFTPSVVGGSDDKR